MKKLLFLAALGIASLGFAQGEPKSGSSNLQNKIQNPIASLISLPFQNNVDFGVGSFNGTRNTLNIQPVIPLSLSDDLNLVTRTIVPIISQPIGPNNNKFGLGDINLSLFLTSANPGKVIFGGGLAIGLPTASSPLLGSEKWSAGPSVIALIQPKGWTIGGLVQNTWSYAGASDRRDIDFFYSQIFVTKNLTNGWYVNTAPIITANWEAASGQKWIVPLGAGFGKLFKIGNLPINGQLGYYYNVVTPDAGADSQLRFQFVLLFPK